MFIVSYPIKAVIEPSQIFDVVKNGIGTTIADKNPRSLILNAVKNGKRDQTGVPRNLAH